jgi:hypothetical protein
MRRGTRGKKQRGNKRSTRRRNQRGGSGAVPVDSVESWLSAVKGSAAFMKSEDKYKLGTYRFEDLKSPSLKLPDMPDTIAAVDPNFNVYKSNTALDPMDLRKLGSGLKDGWNPVISIVPTPTATEFKEYVTKHMDADPELADADFRDLVNHSMFAENTLRTLADEPVINSLTEDDKYPLFIWALMMNPPDKPVLSVPTLVPESETTVVKIEEPASQVEQAT